jgi:mRNA interferase MazF
MPGATFEPYDVVVVPFPFTERPIMKRRPALVISSKSFNAGHDQVVLAMITAARRSTWASDVVIEEWAAAGLAVACRVRLKLFTLPQNLVERRAGMLAPADRDRVHTALRASLAIA